MLFSPMQREMREQQPEPRRRVQSAPRPQLFAAQTLCDRIVYPKPNITPHLLTPPGSPRRHSIDQPDIYELGQLRIQERNEWAKHPRPRSRSRSRNTTHIIGSAQARREEANERERQSSERERRSSERRDSARPRLNRLRSSSLGVLTRGRSDRPGIARRISDRSLSSLGCTSRTAVDLGIHSQPPIPRAPVRSQPFRSVRVRSPVRQGEVVIINNVNYSKPLPPVPGAPPTLEVPPMVPFRREIGIAIDDSEPSTPVDEESHRPAVAIGSSFRSPIRSSFDDSPATSRAHARDALARQHQRAKTRRAFAVPTAGPRQSPLPNLSASVRTTQSRETNPTPTPLHRLTAMEEAIGRSRASSLTNPESTRSIARPRPRTADGPTAATPDVPMSPPLDYPISTLPSPRFNKKFADAMPARPPIAHTDTAATAASGRTVYTDAEEGYDRVPQALDDTPSPREEREAEADFSGLFFRTPQEPNFEWTGRRRSIDFPHLASNVGLGYTLPRRPSSGGASDDSLIATPTILPPAVQLTEASDSERRSSAASTGENRPYHSEYNLARTATTGKRRSSVPEAFRPQRSSRALSPKTFGVQLSDTDTPDGPNQATRSPTSLYTQRDSYRPVKHLSPNPAGSPLSERRDSAAVSFINEFPAPPAMTSHKSAFGQVVTGPPGAGKTTYCNGMHQFLTALKRPVHIINLDPAVPNPPYPCSINISDLVTLDEAMAEHGLGPNGAMLYCVEYLEKNLDWLVERLDELDGGYVIFDTPGQVELWTNHDSLKRIVERLMKMEYRLAAVHLSDAHYITDGSKFISVVLLALRAMMQLEMPHINVLSKIDLLSTYGQLPFDLKYYTEARELGYLLASLETGPRRAKMDKLNKAMVELVEEYGLVGFETLAVEDKKSMLHLLRQIDKATGYIFVPPPGSGPDLLDNAYALFSTGAGDLPGWDVQDVEERWGERKLEYDEMEQAEWEKEHGARRN